MDKPDNPMAKRAGMDILSRLTQASNAALSQASGKARELKTAYIDSEHVLWGLLQDAEIYKLLSEFKVTPTALVQEVEKTFKPGNFAGQPQFSPRVKKVLEMALTLARSLGYEFISPEHILVSLLQEGEGLAAQIMAKHQLNVEKLSKKIKGKKEHEDKEAEKSALSQYTTDLTQMARDGKLDPVVERSQEVERVMHILSRRTKNNPVLIGDAGVGKTAVVEGLAERIAAGKVPETLMGKRILSLDLMSLIAGASHRGEFEERLKKLINEVKVAQGGVILFIDEIHNMVGAGSGEGSMDASNILKPSLARGELQTIGATTIMEYRKHMEKDAALERRFQPILVKEPTKEQAVKMLFALKDKYESFHKVSISDEAVRAAVSLSSRYIGDRNLPDKAVDLIDEAASAVRLPAISLPEEILSAEENLKKLQAEQAEAQRQGNKVKSETLTRKIDSLNKELTEKKARHDAKKGTTTNQVTVESIQDIVSRWSGIPVSRLTESESDKLVKLEEVLHEKIIGQEAAVAAVSEAVRRGRAGLSSQKRPIGSFIFMGPTGVGKTELAKVLADELFGSREMMIRLDMSEYMEKHEVAKLIGAPPGYVGYEEGGQLTEAVRRKPYSVVLFDEIEKANPDVFNILIQILDDGRLTDNKGRTISFKNTIVICTSNIGTDLIQGKEVATKKKEGTGGGFSAMAGKLMEELRKFFRPELLNRFDEIVVFEPLTPANMLKIVDLQLKMLDELIEDRSLRVEVSPAAKEQLAVIGFDPVFGARPLRRTIQRLVENPISTMLIKGEIKEGAVIKVDLAGKDLKFTVVGGVAATAKPESVQSGEAKPVATAAKTAEKLVAVPKSEPVKTAETPVPTANPDLTVIDPALAEAQKTAEDLSQSLADNGLPADGSPTVTPGAAATAAAGATPNAVPHFDELN